LIKKRGPLPEQEVKFYAKQLLGALRYLQTKGICHRDIKPANIIITNTNALKLIDFSVAKRFMKVNDLRDLSTTKRRKRRNSHIDFKEMDSQGLMMS